MPDPTATPPESNNPRRNDARKTVRIVMQEFLRRDSVVPVLRLLLDLTFLGVCIAGACYFSAWWAKALMVIPASVAIARLFVIGHDGCHGSYTRDDRLNKPAGRIAFLAAPWAARGQRACHGSYPRADGVPILGGRIAFLPSLAPSPLGGVGHNVAHH